MIEFRCPNCEQKITTREDCAGSAGRCPRCKATIVVPDAGAPEAQNGAVQDELTLADPLPPRVAETIPASERERLEAEHAAAVGHTGKDVLGSLGIAPLPTYSGQRRYPWLVDMLLYPTSISGLCNLAVIVGVPVTLMIVRRLLGETVRTIGHVFYLADLVIGLYAVWYLGECTFDSARGGTRAPDTSSQKADWRAMLSRVVYLAAPAVVFFLPAYLYPTFAKREDAVYWALVAWGFAFFPMGYLAMVAMDSESALNPLMLLRAIVRTLREYVVLVFVLFAAVVVLRLAGQEMLHWERPIWLRAVAHAVVTYGGFVLAHILGRFYWRHRKQLDWGI